MFDWFSKEGNDAISILKRDHDTVQELFDRFEKETAPAAKKEIVAEALGELKIHAALEEELFYPAVRAALDRDVMNEADEEHHVAKVLIAEIEKMTGKEDHFDAKFTVLAENVRHHIKEEEGEMLPEAKRLPIDFDALGARLMRRKEQLRAEGVPVALEERVADPRADSPARAAKAKKPSAKSKAKAPATRSKTRAAKTAKPKTRTA